MQTLLANAHMHTKSQSPTVHSSAPLSCVSCSLFLAICVKLKNIATRAVKSADVKKHSSADRVDLYLRTATGGRGLGATEGHFTELTACAIKMICIFHFTRDMLLPPVVSIQCVIPSPAESSVISIFYTSSLLEFDIYP